MALNQYSAVASLSPTYDSDGNMTSGLDPLTPRRQSPVLTVSGAAGAKAISLQPYRFPRIAPP